MGNNNAKVSGYKVGNTTGNIMNGGLAAKQGDWIYHISDKNTDNQGICKMLKDGSNPTRIADGGPSINVVNDWIYFIRDGVCKVRTDGSGWEKIIDGTVKCIHVFNDWVYYSEDCSDVKYSIIYKMHISGGEREILLKDNMFGTFCVSGESIYYIGDVFTAGDRYNLYKYTPSEKYRKKLSEDQISEFCILGNSIYFINQDKLTYIYKTSTNGDGRKSFIEIRADSINAHDKCVYFAGTDFSSNICKADLGGRWDTINNEYSEMINIAGNWIFYMNKEDHTTYKVHIDGGESQPV